MNHNFARFIFVGLSLLFGMAFAYGLDAGTNLETLLIGVATSALLMLLLFGAERFARGLPPRAFNTVSIGLAFGSLLAIALLFLFSTVASMLPLPAPVITFTALFLILLSTYLGVVLTCKAEGALHIHIPFVKSNEEAETAILLDSTALLDPRIVDLAASGLVDKRLACPRFLLRSIPNDEEHAKRLAETLQRLETMPHLHLRFLEADFPDIKESNSKLLKLAEQTGATILSAESPKVPSLQSEGVRIINLHTLSSLLKPLMQKGESLKIKIQRYGKEERQGVGYLEDGAMVVVNGGGDYIGETVPVKVLSVKQSSTGRMIFCNVAEDEMECLR